MTEEFKIEEARCMKAIKYMQENGKKTFEAMKPELEDILELKKASDVVTFARGLLFMYTGHIALYKQLNKPLPVNKELNVYIQLLVEARKLKKV